MSNEDPRMEVLRQRYLANQVETATPVQRLLMLQHRLVQDLAAADEAFESGSLEAIHGHLVHAQRVVRALHDPLGGSEWAGAAPLRAVYWFIHQRLVQCNLQKDRSLLPACQEMIMKILEANMQAAAAENEREPVGAQVA